MDLAVVVSGCAWPGRASVAGLEPDGPSCIRLDGFLAGPGVAGDGRPMVQCGQYGTAGVTGGVTWPGEQREAQVGAQQVLGAFADRGG